MRYRFVPSYYTRDMAKKLQNLKQGNDSVKKYYDNLETTLLHSFVEGNEEDFMDRFWSGLNHDIQDMIIHEECYPMDRLYCLCCKAEQEIKRRGAATLTKHQVHIPRVESVVTSTIAPTMGTMSADLNITPPPTCESSPPTVPTQTDRKSVV